MPRKRKVEKIPGSKYYRAFCCGCREPIRVSTLLNAENAAWCDKCVDDHAGARSRAEKALRHQPLGIRWKKREMRV